MSRVYIRTVQDYTVQANWTAYANGIHTALTGTLGWIQTSDTGQIVPATQTVPAQNAYAGYCIYHTNDGIGSVFYLKVEYGRANNTRHPRTRLSVGTGTDGAGNLTGNVSDLFAMEAPGNDPGAAVWRMVVAGNAGQFCFFRSIEQPSPGSWAEGWMITRSVGSNGLPNSNGMEIFATPLNNTWQQFIPATAYSTVVWNAENALGVIPIAGTRRSWMRNINPYFAHPVNLSSAGSQYPNPQVIIWYDYFLPGAMYKITSYGTARSYIFHQTALIGGTSGGAFAFCID